MLYRKAGLPEEHEIVLCTVTKIHFHSVFVRLDEYDNLSGMIHISEVSPGRIRNLNDYVKEGRRIVCKVLRVNRERNQIDLSLRRVNEGIRREKLDSIKQEMKAEKILEMTAKSLKIETKILYNLITEKVFVDYAFLHECFNTIVQKKEDLKKYNFDAKITKALVDMVIQKIKPQEVEFSGTFTISSYEEDGVGVVKDSLNEVFKVAKDATLFYLGSGKYKFSIKGTDLKKLDDLSDKCGEAVIKYAESHNSKASFAREK